MERKLLTILFVDLVDSTGLVTRSDPEIVRRRVDRFFEQVSRCITTYGGTVQRPAGDAVMAAFGIPRAHEDDAERAVRAGLGILDSMKELGLEARVGIESGEVLSDPADTAYATGEAVNVAVRLQQAAAPGQLLIGPGAHRLTASCLETEELGPVELRGIDRPVWAWRVLAAAEPQPRFARVVAPLVGRDAELALLENTFARVARDRRAYLFTIFGEPGVGKSRLAREFLAGLEGATILTGRALPYGEGITYWPLAEMVKVAAGIADDDPVKEAMDKLRACCEDEAVADLLALASGVLDAVEEERSQQEIAWAAREWAERLADVQPLVLVFEDIHWAEEPLLDLIEHLANWVREAPLLILSLARPELLDVRPGWGGGRVRAMSIELAPLSEDDSEELIEALVETPLPAGELEALIEKTGGNPLFLEETVRMLAETDGRNGDRTAERIPDTLHALIAARIDRLPAEDKLLLQRAAVIGRTFWAGAIGHLSPDVEDVAGAIDDLLQREFVLRESRSTISGERAYRFKHVLIREVAYGGLSKFDRANLHARFAGWLAERAGEELLEIRAYHLEQAAALHAELDGRPPQELATEAAKALTEAGKRALAREANRPARKLLLRASELEPTLKRRYLAARAAWHLGDLPAVSVEMENVRREACEAGDTEVEGRALTALADVALLRDAELPRAQELVERALTVLDGTDPDARFDALTLRAKMAWWEGDLAVAERLDREALAVAREAERKDLESQAADSLASVYKARLEVDRASPLVEAAVELALASGSIVAQASALHSRGALAMIEDDLDKAEDSLEQARALFAEAGAAWSLARTLNYLAWTSWAKGDLTKAERLFRDSIKILKPMEDRGTLCESQRGLAQLLVEKGRLEEAERLALEARETVGPHDRTSLATTQTALGIVRAAQGRDDEAETLLRSAVAAVADTDFRNVELETLRPLAHFLRERERGEEAAPLEERLAELAALAGANMPVSAARIA